MGLFDTLFGRRARDKAERVERSGDLAEAVELWLAAGLGDEAARVLLLRADCAPDTETRLAYCEAAAKSAATEEVRRGALGRKASIQLDLLEAGHGSQSRAEWERVARALEEAGLYERAARAFASAKDDEGEVRALTQAGAIDALEARLDAESQRDGARRELETALSRFEDEDRCLSRRAALARVAALLERPPRSGDAREKSGRERLELAARVVRERLVRPPFLRLRWRGEPLHLVLGAEVVVGRSEGSLVLPAPSLSRKHLRLFRAEGGPALEDLGSRNGTRLAGARLERPLPITGRLDLVLGDDVKLAVSPHDVGVLLELGGDDRAGTRLVLPLGAARLGDWELEAEERAWIVLRSEPGARPFAATLEASSPAELCRGDALSIERAGPAALEILGDEAPF